MSGTHSHNVEEIEVIFQPKHLENIRSFQVENTKHVQMVQENRQIFYHFNEIKKVRGKHSKKLE